MLDHQRRGLSATSQAGESGNAAITETEAIFGGDEDGAVCRRQSAGRLKALTPAQDLRELQLAGRGIALKHCQRVATAARHIDEGVIVRNDNVIGAGQAADALDTFLQNLNESEVAAGRVTQEDRQAASLAGGIDETAAGADGNGTRPADTERGQVEGLQWRLA